MGALDRLQHAWNALLDRDNTYRVGPGDLGSSYGVRPDRVRLNIANERSIISSIYTRIAIDVAAVDIRHVRLDDQDRYLSDMNTGLNNCLSVEANVDQTARALVQDIVASCLDAGCVAVVPVDTTDSPVESNSYDVLTMRVGKITQWYPKHVRVDLYNENTGRHEYVTLPKSAVAIIENPLYLVMNEPNSTLQRLIRKLNLLDTVDQQSSSGKLDMIIQLPYVIKSEQRRQQAEQRRKDIEFQLKGSQYGIAYTDGTEKITQLNRPAENNLLAQVEYLTKMLFGQLGLTEEVILGTADEKTMLNYYNRTIIPILEAITGEFKRKFLTKTARTQKQSIKYFRDPFKLVPMSDVADMADKFARNEIFTSNEIRQFIGIRPSKEPKADMLQNSNMPYQDPGQIQPSYTAEQVPLPDSSLKTPVKALAAPDKSSDKQQPTAPNGR